MGQALRSNQRRSAAPSALLLERTLDANAHSRAPTTPDLSLLIGRTRGRKLHCPLATGRERPWLPLAFRLCLERKAAPDNRVYLSVSLILASPSKPRILDLKLSTADAFAHSSQYLLHPLTLASSTYLSYSTAYTVISSLQESLS
jgi:hypothetical protein